MSNKALKIRIYPDNEQHILISKTFGCARKIFNLMLADKIAYYQQTGEQLHVTPVKYKTDYPFLKEIDSLALCNEQLNLQNVYKNFFDNNAGFPKFKAKHRDKPSYTTNNQKGSIRIIDNDHIKLPKIGIVKASVHRTIPDSWDLKSATVSRTSSGKYFVSLLFAYDNQVSDIAGTKAIGFDYSSSKLYVDNNNNSPEVEKQFKKSEKQLAIQQRKLSRILEQNIDHYEKDDKGYNHPVWKRKLSECKNFIKQKCKVARLHEKIANRRTDVLHKLSKEMADNYDVVCIEDLNMKAIGNKHFGNGKATFDNAWGKFTSMLEYKLSDRGKQLIKINKFYPSSQLCHCCNYRNKLVKNLRIRKWDCPVCGEYHDRDHNAAINILNEGLRLYDLPVTA